MNSQLIEYLEDFLEDPKIISASDLPKDQKDLLPNWWVECLNLSNQERIKLIISKWKSLEDVLPITFSFIEHNLSNIEFISYKGNSISMIYKFIFQNSEPSYYEGKLQLLEKALEKENYNLPRELKTFYKEIHNGWTEISSGSLGPMPLENCELISEGDWEMDEIDISKFNLNKLLVVFNNGGCGNLCVNLEYPETNCVIWWSNDIPLKNDDFWAVMDSWIEIGFEEE